MAGPSAVDKGKDFTYQFLSVFGDTPVSMIAGDGKKVSPPDELTPDSGMADRSASLKIALKRLSQSDRLDDDCVDEFVEYFRSLYAEDINGSRFRHMYSDVCAIMYSFFSKETWKRGWMPSKIVYLENNIKLIVDRFRTVYPGEKELDSVVKLQDHISLEAVRLHSQIEWNSSYYSHMTTIRDDVRAEQTNLSKSLEEYKGEVKTVREEIGGTRREYTTILGILAAVVLAFNGAVTFSVSGVNAVSGYHPIYVAFVVSLVGFVLFNALAALFTFLRASIIERKTEDGKRCAIWGAGPLIAFVIADIALVLFVCKLFRIVYEAYLF